MKQWNGLVRKEWASMKWALLAMGIIGIVVLSIFPFLIRQIFGLDIHFYEITLVISFLWALASVLAPVATLFVLLEREMKRPDVWLHSTASIFKLVGSKMVFAVLIGILSLFIPTTMLAIQYTLVSAPIFTMEEMVRFGVGFLVTLFFSSIGIMAIGFFFWVMYRLIKPAVKGFAVPLTLLLFFFSTWLITKITLSDSYQRVVMVGKVDLSKLEAIRLPSGGRFEMGPSEIYTGEIVVDVLITFAMVIGAAVLFEKKVRL
ncbi:hypothetical protein AB1K83_08515 [Sporosarcina sp. 179-K 3D1 HS]|uniref:hypothetical protein n=1 Tax=Sporosarcina sp. 179-K 3D1 HS TaxID=3232169 RepID=UPI00399FF2BA